MIQSKLQEASIQLKNENSRLRDIINSNSEMGKGEVDVIVQERLDLPQKNFILALRKSGNCTLNTRTIQFLQSHAKKANKLQKMCGTKDQEEDEPRTDDKQSNVENHEES